MSSAPLQKPASPGLRFNAPPVAQASAPGKSEPSGLVHPLRAAARKALDWSNVAPVGFVGRQISLHQKTAARTVLSTRLQDALNALETVAHDHRWSQRELARRAGVPQTTLRRIKRGVPVPSEWLPILERARTRLTQPAAEETQPATLN
jgi:hypothetical protein